MGALQIWKGKVPIETLSAYLLFRSFDSISKFGKAKCRLRQYGGRLYPAPAWGDQNSGIEVPAILGLNSIYEADRK